MQFNHAIDILNMKRYYCLSSLFHTEWFPNKRLATVNSLSVNKYVILERFKTEKLQGGDQQKHG